MAIDRDDKTEAAALRETNRELSAALQKAETANRDMARFLAAASHDLLQPLNAAHLYTASMVEQADAATRMGQLARSVESSLNAVEEIVNALLDISRIDSGSLKVELRPFRVSELMQKVVVEFGPQAAERKITLKVIESDTVVHSDKALVARIIQNLVSNAIKYTRPGGRVLVGCLRRGGRMRLDVIDTGIGFQAHQHRVVFAEFSRLEQGARMAHGLGLGLSIVDRLVSALGLTLEIDSVEGKGSRFSLYLPHGKMAEALPADGKSGPLASLSGLRVLCVDNERDVIAAMEGLLAGWGCDVRSAGSLRDIERQQLLIGWLPDLVLMDYHLDQVSGLDAVEWLRQNLGHLPAALVTADRTPGVRALAEQRGIPILNKPVRPASLRALMSTLAGRVQAPAGLGAD